MRRLLVPLLAAALLGVPAVSYAGEAACPQEVLDVRGSNVSYATLAGLLEDSAEANGIPPQVLKAIAFKESGWRQFHADGRPLISGADDVCGIGVMQLTLGNRTDGVQLASDVAFNVAEGAKHLKGKWVELQKQTHPAPAGYALDDPDVIENWYAAICRYNGCLGSADMAYAHPVAELIKRPFQLGVPSAILGHMPPGGFTTPYEADASYDFPWGFQAQHDPDRFVFYDPDTGVVSGTVDIRTHLGSTPFPGYGPGGYGPNGLGVSCTDCAFWRPVEGTGIAGSAHWTNSVTGNDAAKVTWIPPRTGTYDVRAYIPAIGTDTLATATYHLGTATQTVAQNDHKNAWVSLGRRSLSAAAPVWVGDHSTVAGRKIVADALRLSAVPTLSVTTTATTLTYGAATTLTAKLTHGGSAVAGRSVKLYKRAAGTTTWSPIGTYVTSAGGTVAISVKPSVNAEYTARFTAPDAAWVSVASGNRRVDVRPKVTATLARTSVPRGTATTLSVSVAPSHAGRTVYLQRLVNGAWQNAASKALGSASSTSFAVSRTTAGTYYYRVVLPAHADHTTGTSARLTLKVT
ncbi:MAG TPA: hypothetical protein VNQ77_00265 [Frankiaceae bacterium]|nr:hypothetical protein [Frankiaceae bacterium]